MRVIEEIKISYFRSFSNETKIIKLNDLNIISGKNDSGKSNILKALNLFFTENKVDFYNTFDFEKDFSKPRAGVSKVRKIKKKIQISILFNRYKFSAEVLPEKFWVEKEWDANGIISKSRKTRDYRGQLYYYKGSDVKVEASTTSFLKKIHFLYIPAIKDYRFFDYLKREYQESLATKFAKDNDQVDKTIKLSLEEWKEKLSVAEITDLLGEKIDTEAKGMMKHFLGNAKEVETSNFKIPDLDFSDVLEVITENDIPLTSRGDGIQAKFIPQILNEITRNKSADIVVWGFEEPENSYEYANAQLLADKFKDEYSIDKQIFLTSHAFNFISLKSSNISLYRAWKKSLEEGTCVTYISNNERLFEYEDDILKDELGVIQLNQELETFFRQREQDRKKELEEHQTKSKELSDQIKKITKPLIITEGKTDWKHLKKAYTSLNIDFEIDFWEYSQDMGHAALEKMVKEYCKISQPKKIIFMFDRDDDTIVNEYAKKEFNSHGNNVYSFCIPKINEILEKISIEFYYKTEHLKINDINGRRVFIGTEFHKSGNSICGYYQAYSKNKCNRLTIIDEKVYSREDLENQHSIALCKNDFAENILKSEEGFESIDFENFRLIFDVIGKILNN